jgi:hypothetical protein
MKDEFTQRPGPITVSGVHLAEISILTLAKPGASDAVAKVLVQSLSKVPSPTCENPRIGSFAVC